MDKLHLLNISKHNMNKVLCFFNEFNIDTDILLNISNNQYFLDVLSSLLYKQSDNSIHYKIIIAPKIEDDASYLIIDDEFCEKLGFIEHNEDVINIFEFYLNISNTYFYLKTSGSTGDPVLIKKYVYQMINEAKCLKSFLGSDFYNKTVCSIVPHHHLYGLTFAVFMPIVCNFPVIEQSPLLENLSQFKENILITSPEFLKKLVQYNKDFLPLSINNIELIITAGSMLDDKTRNQLKNITNAKILNIYGSTETGIIAGDIGDGFRLFSSVTIDDNILISEWSDKFRLQDEIEIKNDKLEIYGRKDRIIKIADKRFSLDMVEKYIKQSDLIYDAYAYVINNRIGVLISLTEEGKKVFRNNGKKGIVENINKYTDKVFGKNIRHYKITSNIFRNNNGKLIKKENDGLINHKEQLKFIQEKIEKNEQGITALFTAYISEDIFYLPLHFYNFPLIPGFIELDHIIKLSAQFGYDFMKINKISNLKFVHFIRPMDNIKIELIMLDNIVKFNIYADNIKAASGNIKYER